MGTARLNENTGDLLDLSVWWTPSCGYLHYEVNPVTVQAFCFYRDDEPHPSLKKEATMPTQPTITRFIEAFVAIFLVEFGASAIFASGSVDLFGTEGLQAIAVAAVAAAGLALRRALAVKQS